MEEKPFITRDKFCSDKSSFWLRFVTLQHDDGHLTDATVLQRSGVGPLIITT